MTWQLIRLDGSQTDAWLLSPEAQKYLGYAGGDEGFAIYLKCCDARCIKATGISIFDIADYMWRDCYEGDVPPAEAVLEALKGDDMLGGMFE